MKFSFVIPAYKSESTLLKCLKGIFDQTELVNNNYEIIIVLCRSSVNFEKLIPNQVNIIKLKTNVKNRAYSRNLGSSIATGEFLIFVDSDIFLTQNWLKNSISVFKNKLVAASQGSFIWDKNCNKFVKNFGFKPNLETSIFSEYGPVVVTGACIYRASIFNSIGKFTETVLWNEDLNLSITAFNTGYAIAYSQSAIAVLLNEKYSLLSNLKRSFKSGFYSCKLNKYYYNNFKLKDTSQFYFKMILLNVKKLKHNENRKMSFHFILNFKTRILGYLVGALSINKMTYNFPKESKPYIGIKKELREKYSSGLLYINNRKCLYSSKNRKLNWIN